MGSLARIPLLSFSRPSPWGFGSSLAHQEFKSTTPACIENGDREEKAPGVLIFSPSLALSHNHSTTRTQLCKIITVEHLGKSLSLSLSFGISREGPGCPKRTQRGGIIPPRSTLQGSGTKPSRIVIFNLAWRQPAYALVIWAAVAEGSPRGVCQATGSLSDPLQFREGCPKGSA